MTGPLCSWAPRSLRTAGTLAKGKKLFHIVMKFHTMHHLIRNGRFINPRFTCNWKGEDFVGQVARLSHSVTAGVRSTRISTKTSQNIGSCCTCSSLALALAKKAYMMMNRILAKRIAGLFHSLPKGMLASPCQKEFLVKRILWLHVHFPCPKDHLLDKRGKLVLGQRSRIILAKQKKRCCSVAGWGFPIDFPIDFLHRNVLFFIDFFDPFIDSFIEKKFPQNHLKLIDLKAKSIRVFLNWLGSISDAQGIYQPIDRSIDRSIYLSILSNII